MFTLILGRKEPDVAVWHSASCLGFFLLRPGRCVSTELPGGTGFPGSGLSCFGLLWIFGPVVGGTVTVEVENGEAGNGEAVNGAEMNSAEVTGEAESRVWFGVGPES